MPGTKEAAVGRNFNSAAEAVMKFGFIKLSGFIGSGRFIIDGGDVCG